MNENMDRRADRQMDNGHVGGFFHVHHTRTRPSETAHPVVIHPELPLEVNLKYHNINCICLSERKTETQVLELIPGVGICTSIF